MSFSAFLFWGQDLAASAAQMPEIQRRGYLNIAVKDNLRPLGFRDANGNLQGLEIDLAKRLAVDLLGKADAVKLQPVVKSRSPVCSFKPQSRFGDRQGDSNRFTRPLGQF